jgi:hypothetical protein
LLDFRVFTSALKQEFEGSTGVLRAYAEYFETLSALPLWCDELGCAVQFTTGQPLGMKGSFQVLTWMNFLAAGAASLGKCCTADVMGIARVTDNSLKVGDAPFMAWSQYDEPANFAVVGDDTVIKADARALYDAIIRSWNGQTNAEKCLVSNKTAEFLSHLITPSAILVTKPKYRLGSRSLFVNAEKAKVRDLKASGLYRLSPDDVTALQTLSAWSTKWADDRASLPKLRSRAPGAISEYDKTVMDSALRIAAELGDRPDDLIEVTPQSSDLMLSLNPSAFTRMAGNGPALGPRRRPTDAITPTTTIYDHHKGEHRDVSPGDQSLAAQYQASMALASRISRLSDVWFGGALSDDGNLNPESGPSTRQRRVGPTDETVLLVAAELVDQDGKRRPTDVEISNAARTAIEVDFPCADISYEDEGLLPL